MNVGDRVQTHGKELNFDMLQRREGKLVIREKYDILEVGRVVCVGHNCARNRNEVMIDFGEGLDVYDFVERSDMKKFYIKYYDLP